MLEGDCIDYHYLRITYTHRHMEAGTKVLMRASREGVNESRVCFCPAVFPQPKCTGDAKRKKTSKQVQVQ